MTESDRDGVIGDGMRFGWGEIWSAEIFVEICPTDAYVGRGDLLVLTVILHCFEKLHRTYPDLPCITRLLVHIFNPDILLTIVSCCAHVLKAVPRQLEDVSSTIRSPSRLTMLVTKALSMAGMSSVSSFESRLSEPLHTQVYPTVGSCRPDSEDSDVCPCTRCIMA